MLEAIKKRRKSRFVSDEDDEETWPEHLKAEEVFRRCSSQWNVQIGMSGAVYLGLKYESVEVVLNICQIPNEDRLEIFDELRIIESEALSQINDKK